MTTILAEYGSFVVSSSDTALRKRTASSCQPEVTTIWFPVLPGTTELPVSPEPVINESPEAPNSVAAPIDFDPENPDLCALFNDILPISSPPIYPVEQTVELLSAPYIETVLVPTITRARLGVTSIDYPLSVEGGSVSLATKTKLALANLYIAAENAIFAFTGNTAEISRRKDISPVLGYFFTSPPSQASFAVRPYTAVFPPVVNLSIEAKAAFTIPGSSELVFLPPTDISLQGLPCSIALDTAIRILSPVSIEVSAATPLVSAGLVVTIPAPTSIALSAPPPSIRTGSSTSVAPTNVDIAMLAPSGVGGPIVLLAIPIVDIVVLGQLPIISSGKSLATPVSQVSISGQEPEVLEVIYGALVPTTDVAILTINPVVAAGVSLLVPSSSLSVAFETPFVELVLALEEVVRIGTAPPVLGAGGAVHPPVGWNVLQNASADDTNIGSFGWTFDLTIDSTPHNYASIGSNTYITFGPGSSSAYSGLSETNPFLNKIFFGASDNSYQRVYDRAEVVEGISVQRIRYEGTASTSGTLGNPNIVAEFTFFQPFSDGRQLIELRVGSHSRTSGLFMIASRNTAYASSTITANSSWVFIGNSTGTSWTMTPNRFVALGKDRSINVPSTEVAVSSNPAEVEALVPQAIVPLTNITISSIEPSLNTNIVLEVPSTDLAINAELPRIAIDTYFSSLATQVYTWERDFMVDWWAD